MVTIDADQNYGSLLKIKSFSKSSLTAIALHVTGKALGDDEVKWLSQKITEDIKKLLNEAGKYARRVRDDRVRLHHIQHAARTVCPDVFSRLLLRGEVFEEPVTETPSKECNQSSPEVQEIQLSLDCIWEPENPSSSQIASTNQAPYAPLDSAWLRQKRARWMRQERAHLMPRKNFPLTKEQLEFYLIATESCMGASELRRLIALHALSTDPSVEVLLPRLCVFIKDAVTVNVAEQNIIFLFYAMRMVKALLSNSRLNLHRYLHLLLPAVLSCLLTKHGFFTLGLADHWSLREYSGSIATEMVRHYEASESSLLPRVIATYKEGLMKEPLYTVYGAVLGLGKMGNDAARTCILPKLLYLSGRIEPHLVYHGFCFGSLNTLASLYISHRLMKMCHPLLDSNPQDSPEVYTAAYGYLGPKLRSAFILSRFKLLARKIAKTKNAKLS